VFNQFLLCKSFLVPVVVLVKHLLLFFILLFVLVHENNTRRHCCLEWRTLYNKPDRQHGVAARVCL